MGAHNDEIITKVKNGLFETAQYLGKDVLKESVKKLHFILGSTACSLWSINHNNTGLEENKEFLSASLICRECAISYIFSNQDDYVYDLKNSFFHRVINAPMLDNSFFIFSKEDALSFGHKSKDFIEEAGLTMFIIFPIFDYEKNSVTALLEISYHKCDWDEQFWCSLAKVTQPFFSAAFSREAFVRKQSLLESLIKIHRQYKDAEVSVLINKIVHKVLLIFCPAQKASVFIWDTYQNCYKLVPCSGLEGESDVISVFYQKGEAVIGRIGQTGLPLIIDDVYQEETEKQVLGLHSEKLDDYAKTEMVIPIIDPTPTIENDVIGIFRFVNKKNAWNERIIDYFNDSDVEMMMYAADYLSLIIANYQKEESQYNFIDKLTHEIVTPANAILKSADRLYTHLGDQEFLSKNLSPYLKNIIDFAGLQRWQAVTNLFLSRNRKKMPFDVRYNIRPTRLYEVIKESIEITRPIARKYNVKFDDICIDPLADLRLTINIDKNAFITVFYNLFTNAIKYSEPDILKEQFCVLVSYTMNESSLVIEVADNGIGISQDEEQSIFEIGYRGKSAIRINASGYGIGLSVIKQIIEDFGGIIAITHYRKPTVFQIRLPKDIML